MDFIIPPERVYKESLYREIDVNGTKVKVVDFSKFPKEGTIEFRAIERRHNSTQFNGTKDPKHEVWYAIPEGRDQDGNIRFRKIMISGNRQLNLEIPSEQMEAVCLAYSNFVIGSPLHTTADRPTHKIYDRLQAAKQSTVKMKKALAAKNQVLSIEGNIPLLSDFARILGITPEGVDPEIVLDLIMKKADEAPDEVSNKFRNVNRRIEETIKRAVSYSIIKYTPATGYRYFDYFLGANESEVEATLLKNKELFATIDKESLAGAGYSREDIIGVAPAEKQVKPIKVAEYETPAHSTGASMPPVMEGVSTRPPRYKVDDAFMELKAKAKELKIKGYQFMNAETLRMRIKQAEIIAEHSDVS